MLTGQEVDFMLKRVPKLYKSNDRFFCSLGSDGLISFSEYLFLLTILIKPQSGFKIAFAMLDQDGNEQIDKQKFRVLERVFSSAAKDRKIEAEGQDDGVLQAAKAEAISQFDDSDHGLHRAHNWAVNTTLLIYFFGDGGDGQLGFNDFKTFMDNLQTKVLAMEYNEFAKGANSITEIDFARILLRYTFLLAEEYEQILDRLVRRLLKIPRISRASDLRNSGTSAYSSTTWMTFRLP